MGPQRVMAVADSSGDGLISFEEYVFFTTLLSIPTKYFEIAFRVMDVNNDGEVDAGEFRKAKMRRFAFSRRDG